jgi:hypothetical protein
MAQGALTLSELDPLPHAILASPAVPLVKLFAAHLQEILTIRDPLRHIVDSYRHEVAVSKVQCHAARHRSILAE